MLPTHSPIRLGMEPGTGLGDEEGLERQGYPQILLLFSVSNIDWES